jgi:acyl-CoA synthetase (AMP-forming)/AMP-acid ligase II
MRGVGLMPGYFRDPEATAAVIREGGWYASGDLGELHADGALFVVGRLKEMIIRSGFNVYPAEVEAVLNAFPAIERSAVVGGRNRTATRTSWPTWNCATAPRWTRPRCAAPAGTPGAVQAALGDPHGHVLPDDGQRQGAQSAGCSSCIRWSDGRCRSKRPRPTDRRRAGASRIPSGRNRGGAEPQAQCERRIRQPLATARPCVERSRHAVLLDLLEQSLARGHWKLALRRYLMLLACGCEVPAAQREACERHLLRCEPRGLRKDGGGRAGVEPVHRVRAMHRSSRAKASS